MSDEFVTEYILGVTIADTELTAVIVTSDKVIYNSHVVQLSDCSDTAVLQAIDNIVSSVSVKLISIVIACNNEGQRWSLANYLATCREIKQNRYAYHKISPAYRWCSYTTVIDYAALLISIAKDDPNCHSYQSILFVGLDHQGCIYRHRGLMLGQLNGNYYVKTINPWIEASHPWIESSHKRDDSAHSVPRHISEADMQRIERYIRENLTAEQLLTSALYCYGSYRKLAADDTQVVTLMERLGLPVYLADNPQFVLAISACNENCNVLVDNVQRKKRYPIVTAGMLLVALTVILVAAQDLLGAMYHERVGSRNTRKSPELSYQFPTSTTHKTRIRHTYDPNIVSQFSLDPSDTDSSTPSSDDTEKKTSESTASDSS